MQDSLLEHVGRNKFRGYVQRVAFSLTLSEPMIRMLRIVRDWPPHTNKKPAGWDQKQTDMRTGYHADLFIKEIRALEVRGLAYHNPGPEKMDRTPEGHVFFKLTRAGELTCDLLVEANLMEPAQPRKRKAA